MQRILLAAAVSVLAAGPVLAQTPGGRPPQAAAQPPAAGPGEIRGTVVDSDNNAPVASASVAVWSADSVLVAGAIAGANGAFRIQGLQPGSYVLKVTRAGYGAHSSSPLTVAAAAPRINAGSIRMSRRAITLEAIDVTAERSTATIAPDRSAYRSRDVAPAATTASEVLEAVPSVQVDADGKVSLRGNENVVVQINGRPSPIRGEQLAGYLRQLPANTLDRVEVMPNPSAKQDPEGMAGIINIVLKQNVDLGISGGVTLGASTADRYTASGNLGYQRGAATLFLNYGFSTDDRAQAGVNDRTRLGQDQAPVSYTEQDISGTQGNGGHNLNATLDYKLGERDVVSTGLMLNSRGARDESTSALSEFSSTRLLLDAYDRIRDNETDSRMADWTLGFKHTFEPQRHELSAEVRANRMTEEDRSVFWRQRGDDAFDAEDDYTDASSTQLNAQVDYTRGLAERTKLETGYKGTYRALDRDFTVLRDEGGTGAWVPDASMSNALDFDESVNAVYGVLSHGVGRLELQGGLRAEYATRDFSLADAEESYPYTYTSLFPSAMASYNLTDKTQVKASYSRRVRRPGTQELNPFPTFFDAQNVFLGNPELNPEYTDAVELGLQHSTRLGSVQFSPFYRRTTDVIRFIINTADTVAGREVTSVSFRNLATGSSWGADLNGQLRLGQVFSGMAAFNVFKMVTEGGSGEADLSSDAVTWSARFSGTFNASPRTSLSAMYFYRAPMNVEGGKFDAFGFANVSVRHKLMGDRANVTLRLSDPFNTQRFRVRAGDDNLVQLTERTFTSRALHLTVQYNFGQAPRVRPRRQDAQPEPSGSPFPG